MKIRTNYTLLLLISAFFLLSGCGPATGGTPVQETGATTLPGLQGAPLTQTPLPDNYPSPEQVLPPPTPTLDPNYPAQPTLPPTPDPYPGGTVWVIRPVGIQCEEGTAPGYGDLREAQSTLTAAGVKVAEAEMTELMVTTSCGSPTSAHFRVQIAAEDLQTALSMGWMQE